jgi:type IV pilus assembly protein PilC
MMFSYSAINRDGVKENGTYDAGDRAQVVAYLKSRGMTPISVNKSADVGLNKLLPKKKTQAKDLSMFCEQFCALLRAGVTIVDALTLLLEQTKDKALREAIQTTISTVNEGESLGAAMGKSPKVFNSTLVSLVKAGEESGSLDTSLERMSEQYKKDAEMAAAIKKALSYPIIVLVVALIVVVVMFIYVVPSFTSMFAEVGIEMPKITLMVMAASDWMIQNIHIVIIAVIAIVAAVIYFVGSKTGKKVLSKLALKLPGISNFTVKTNAAKIARTLSTLLTAGMTIVEALSILESTLTNHCYKEALREIREDVLTGQPMSRKFLAKPELFPSMLAHMISVGEDTGDIPSMLIRTAEYYDLEVETATETLMSMMSPMIMVLLTGVVGVLIAAVFAPMLAMYSQLGDSI